MNDKTKTNDLNQLIKNEPETELDTLKDKDLMLIDEYLETLNVREAFRRVGYAESTVNSGYPYQKFRQPKFQEKLRSAYIAKDYRDLAIMYHLEHKGLVETARQAETKPESIIENLPKLKHIAKQKKQIAGILRDDVKPSGPTVHIGNLFVGQAGAHPHSVLFQEHNAIDAEIVKDEDKS